MFRFHTPIDILVVPLLEGTGRGEFTAEGIGKSGITGNDDAELSAILE